MLFYCTLVCTWLIISGAKGLKITRLSVPKVVDIRTSALLSCEFNLENSKLYSVKWYKDDLEFCRFMPDATPEVQIFKVEGVHLSPKECNMTTVKLNPLEFVSSGLYTCEVSTEAPYFKTVQTASNMTILGIPGMNPIINGIKDVYAVGDYVEGNCTSDASYPPSVLEWYINDNQVESWQLENYPSADEDEFRLRRSILGVSFQVDNSHFAGEGNTMVLKCVAKVRNLSRQSLHISKLADLDLEKSAQGLYGNGSVKKKSEAAVTVLVTLTVAYGWYSSSSLIF